MIRNLNEKEVIPDYDLCIIGSGPAGMSLCAELCTSALKILVIESGEGDHPGIANSLRRTEAGILPIKENSRERVLGGTSETWMGLSSLYDRIDFQKRSFVNNGEGWPIELSDLEPYIRKAAIRYKFPFPESFEIGEFLTKEEKKELHWEKLEPKTFLAVRPAFQFGKELKYIFSRPNVDLITGLTVTELVADKSNAKKISFVACRGLDRGHLEIKAKEFVLAAGTIENNRILLNSKSFSPSGIGNEHNQVGRYFMNHPKGYSGRIILKNRFTDRREYFWKKQKNYSGYIGLRVKESLQFSDKILNSYVRLEEGSVWANKKELIFVKKFLSQIKSLPASILRRKNFTPEIREVVKTFPKLVISLPVVLKLVISRYILPEGKRPSYLLPRYFLEMEPRAENRITLSEKTDSLGVSIPRVNYDLSQLDKSSFLAIEDILAKECERLDIGTLIKTGSFPMEDSSHHFGGTRMGIDVKTSVVDANLRVHSTNNLYVTGGSVFPTGGCANPTLTFVALSIRLAEYLREKIFYIPVNKVENKNHQNKTTSVIIIGAGGRVQNDILPTLESLPEYFTVNKIFGRSNKAIFGKEKIHEVEPISKLNKEDISFSGLVYISVPSSEVKGVIDLLLKYDCSHLDIILPTPILPKLSIELGRFKRVSVEEDSVFLPWIPALKRFCKKGAGKIRKIILNKSAYKYHAISLIKTLCVTGSDAKIRRKLMFGLDIHFYCANTDITLIEPRDYNTGHMKFICENAVITDMPETGAISLEYFSNGTEHGFRVGSEIELLSTEEAELLGKWKEGDTIVSRMHDCKRVGLRRLLQYLKDNKTNPWPLEEGRDDFLTYNNKFLI